MSRRQLVTRGLTPLADLDLDQQVAYLEQRLQKLRVEHPTHADEIERLARMAADLRTGTTSPPAASATVSTEDSAEITRLAKLVETLRGTDPAEPPTAGSETGPDDRAEIDRLAALAKERA